MKSLIKNLFIYFLVLYFIPNFIQGIIYEQGLVTIILTAAALTVSALFIKPIINILLLPINLLTFGLLRWVSSAVTLYLITLIITDFKVEKFIFAGFSTEWIEIPSISFEGFLAFIAFSFVISFAYSIIH